MSIQLSIMLTAFLSGTWAFIFLYYFFRRDERTFNQIENHHRELLRDLAGDHYKRGYLEALEQIAKNREKLGKEQGPTGEFGSN
jgi:hypothetical protein